MSGLYRFMSFEAFVEMLQRQSLTFVTYNQWEDPFDYGCPIYPLREMGSLIDEPHAFVQELESLKRRLDLYEYVQFCEALKTKP